MFHLLTGFPSQGEAAKEMPNPALTATGNEPHTPSIPRFSPSPAPEFQDVFLAAKLAFTEEGQHGSVQKPGEKAQLADAEALPEENTSQRVQDIDLEAADERQELPDARQMQMIAGQVLGKDDALELSELDQANSAMADANTQDVDEKEGKPNFHSLGDGAAPPIDFTDLPATVPTPDKVTQDVLSGPQSAPSVPEVFKQSEPEILSSDNVFGLSDTLLGSRATTPEDEAKIRLIEPEAAEVVIRGAIDQENAAQKSIPNDPPKHGVPPLPFQEPTSQATQQDRSVLLPTPETNHAGSTSETTRQDKPIASSLSSVDKPNSKDAFRATHPIPAQTALPIAPQLPEGTGQPAHPIITTNQVPAERQGRVVPAKTAGATPATNEAFQVGQSVPSDRGAPLALSPEQRASADRTQSTVPPRELKGAGEPAGRVEQTLAILGDNSKAPATANPVLQVARIDLPGTGTTTTSSGQPELKQPGIGAEQSIPAPRTVALDTSLSQHAVLQAARQETTAPAAPRPAQFFGISTPDLNSGDVAERQSTYAFARGATVPTSTPFDGSRPATGQLAQVMPAATTSLLSAQVSETTADGRAISQQVDGGLADLRAAIESLQPTTRAQPLGGMQSAPADVPRQVTQQIATAIQNGSDRSIEILLNPAELGKVRISLTPSDLGMNVNIFADRPETSDLLRRHVDLLAQDFRDIGYDTAEFSFGQSGQQGQNDASSDTSSGTGDAEGRASDQEADTPATQARPGPTGPGRMDIRI